MSELKKCPFCCGEVFVYQTGSVSNGIFKEVICKSCGSRTDRLREDLAIEAWNTRKPMANIVEKLEYEKERHEKDRAYWSDKPWKDSCVYNECDMADKKIDCYDDAINIVKQEINNGLE